MADQRIDPRGIRPDGGEGDTAQIVGGIVQFAPAVVLTPLVALVNGVPGLVFDANGQLVYTKGAS